MLGLGAWVWAPVGGRQQGVGGRDRLHLLGPFCISASYSAVSSVVVVSRLNKSAVPCHVCALNWAAVAWEAWLSGGE